MKKYREKVVQQTYTEVEKVECDICHKEFNNSDWDGGIYDIKITEISLQLGKSYPDNGNSSTYSFDICPDCFLNQLMPWFESHNGYPTKTDADW